ncbi:MAG: HPr family phosphocarrier protein [Verrucomicrobiales bacterium]
MKRSTVVVPWNEGLHLRPAAQLVRVAQRFSSTILMRCDEKIADVRSILSVIALCATMGTVIDIEVTGEDEQTAIEALEHAFSAGSSDIERD